MYKTYNMSKYDLNRQPGYEDRRYYLGYYIQAQLAAGGLTIADDDRIERAGKVDFESLSDFDALKGIEGSGINGGIVEGVMRVVGGGGYTKPQTPPGVYTCVSMSMLQKLNQYFEIPITIWVIIALRRLFNEPIDIMLGLEYLPHIQGGSQTIRSLRRVNKMELMDRTKLTKSVISTLDKFSRWSYDNKAGKIETPAVWILDQLVKNKVTWNTLLKMRNSLELNIDDLLGMCYNE